MKWEKIAFGYDRVKGSGTRPRAPKFILRGRYEIKNCNPFFIILSYNILLIIQPLLNNYISDSRNRISNNTYFEAH